LDSQSGQTFGDRFQTKEYGFTNTTAYLYYRLTITRNNGSGLLQLAEVQLSTGAAGGTVGDPKSWLLKGSYDGRHWTVIDQRTNEMFRWRSQTRVFKVANPGRFAYYELDVTDNGGAQSTALSEVEFLATPRPVCDKVISGEQGGPLTVNAGVTCIDGGTVHGPVTVRPGASLYAIGGKIDGPVSASGATAVVLAGTVVGGPVSITGTTGEASVETAQIAGPVSLVNNKGPLVSASTVGGPLSCTGNNPVPLDNGLDNTIGGPAAGQCAGM